MFQSLGFTGAYQDAITMAYPLGNGHRFDLPGLMRFNARDNVSPFGPGGINPYAYCTCDPINHSDPTGRVEIDPEVLAAVNSLLDDVVKNEGNALSRSSTPAPPDIDEPITTKRARLTTAEDKTGQGTSTNPEHQQGPQSAIESGFNLLRVDPDAELQDLAPLENIFILQKTNHVYSFSPMVPGARVPRAHGLFSYVVPIPDKDNPLRVLCGVSRGNDHIPERFHVEGHTSISHRQPVLYAGDMALYYEQMGKWNNNSGHYTPPSPFWDFNPVAYNALEDLLPWRDFRADDYGG